LVNLLSSVVDIVCLSQGSLERLVLADSRVLWDSLELADCLELLDHVDRMVLRVHLDSLETADNLDRMVT